MRVQISVAVRVIAVMWITQGGRGSEAIRAMWKKQTTERMDCTAAPSIGGSLGLTYLSAEANFTCLCRS